MKFKLLFLAMISALALTACEKKTETAPAAPATPATTEQAPATPAATEQTPAPAATEQAPATPAATEQTPAPAATEQAPAEEKKADEAAATTGSTGIPECDEFIEKTMACYEGKVPENMRGAMIDGVNQMKAAWSNVSEADKAATAQACKDALAASKASLQAYGCEL